MNSSTRLIATLATDTAAVAGITVWALICRPLTVAAATIAVAGGGLALAYPAVTSHLRNGKSAETRARRLLGAGLALNTAGSLALLASPQPGGRGRWAIPLALLVIGDRLSLTYLSGIPATTSGSWTLSHPASRNTIR